MLLGLHTRILHAIIATLHLDNLFAITHTQHFKGVGLQGQNLFGALAFKICFAYPLLKELVFPLQLAILRKHSHSNIQLAHSKMVGALNIANNIIQIAAKENFLVNKITPCKIIGYTHYYQGRNNQLGLQIAHQQG